MDRRARARIALTAPLATACGAPSDPGGGETTDAPPSSITAGPATTTAPPTTGDDGSGSGDATTAATTHASAACPPVAAVAERGFFKAGATDIELTACGEDRYFAAASESTVEVSLTRRSGARVTAVVASAKWGDYRGEMIADHIDEVGQILGITNPKFDHLGFDRARARELADELH